MRVQRATAALERHFEEEESEEAEEEGGRGERGVLRLVRLDEELLGDEVEQRRHAEGEHAGEEAAREEAQRRPARAAPMMRSTASNAVVPITRPREAPAPTSADAVARPRKRTSSVSATVTRSPASVPAANPTPTRRPSMATSTATVTTRPRVSSAPLSAAEASDGPRSVSRLTPSMSPTPRANPAMVGSAAGLVHQLGQELARYGGEDDAGGEVLDDALEPRARRAERGYDPAEERGRGGEEHVGEDLSEHEVRESA